MVRMRPFFSELLNPLLRVALCEVASALELSDSSSVIPLWWLAGWYSVAGLGLIVLRTESVFW